MIAAVLLGAAFVFVGTLCTSSAGSRAKVRLNESSFLFAQELIDGGHITVDRRNAWSGHHPSAIEENEFIRIHGFTEYAKWHLGIDDTHAEDTKARYKFPYGDFKNVHRCGVLAAKSRARQYGYSDIENAAARLNELMTSKSHSATAHGND